MTTKIWQDRKIIAEEQQMFDRPASQHSSMYANVCSFPSRCLKKQQLYKNNFYLLSYAYELKVYI